jgi:hypothetical protein
MRHAQRDTVEADGEAGAQPLRQLADRGGEQLPLVVRLGPGEQQERGASRVVHQVHDEFQVVVALPVILVEDHDRAPGPIVDEPVHVEGRDDLVVQVLQQMLGEQPPGRAGVDEAVEIPEQSGAIQLRGGGIHLVEFSPV